jgi:uncharacterized repeat protein (TIGR01451 family)
VRLDAPVQGGFSLDYSTNDATATTADNDYLDDDGSIAFAGTAAEGHGITVEVVGDTKVEADETFTVALGAISGLAPGIDPADITVAGTPAVGTILDDDAGVFGSTLAARKTVSGTPLVGSTIHYTIEVTNLGPGDQADNPGDELLDILPSQVALLDATADWGAVTADPVGNAVTWNGALASSQTATIVIDVVVLPTALGVAVSNQATLAFDTNHDGTNDGTSLSDDPDLGGTDDPTSFVGLSVLEIPTLGSWGLVVMALALGLLGLRGQRSRDHWPPSLR